MKVHLTLTLLLCVLSAKTSFSFSRIGQFQSKNDTVKRQKKDSLIQISKEIKVVKGAVPKFQTTVIKPAKPDHSMPAGWKGSDTWYPPVEPIDPVIPIDPEPGLNPAASETSNAGRTNGTLDVSSTGASTYNVPLTLPPGLGSAIPQIALGYNSQAGNGMAGYGWSISGLSSISRLPATNFHDSRVGGVNFDQNDRFALDGQRLMLKSGTYGADGAEYQTENYSNVKVVSKGVSPFGTNYGPAYFIVYYPDGTKAFYGNSYDSRTPSDYAITYTENPVGARINYVYSQSNNTMYIAQINYGSVGAAVGINQVNFNYESSNRTEQAYIAGISLLKDKRISKISVIGNGTGFRHYKLKYVAMVSLNYDQLSTLEEYEGNENTTFGTIYFNYSATGQYITSHTISNLSLSGIASNNSEITTGDFTGDGSMDFLLHPKYGKDKFWAFYDLEPGNPYIQLGYQVNTGSYRELFPVTSLTHNNKILAGQGILLVKNVGFTSYKFEVYSSSAAVPVLYQYDKVWNNLPTSSRYYSECDGQEHDGFIRDMEFVSGDFNGDGLSDVIAITNASVITHQTNVWIQDPYDDRASYWDCQNQYGDAGSGAYLINMDRRLTSNYISDLGALSSSFFYGDKLYTGDMNGDGKADIVHVKNGSMYVYGINQNNGIELLWQIQDGRVTNTQPIFLGDYNGDGKTDVMFSTGNNSLFATFMSTGKSFIKNEQYQPFSNPAGNWNGTPGVETMTSYYLIANDIDGDGKTDMILAETITKNNNANGTAKVTVYHNTGVSSAYQPSFGSVVSTSSYTNLRHNPIPIFLTPDKPNYKLEFGFMSDNSISLFKFHKDFRKETLLSNVFQGGVYHKLEYKQVGPESGYVELPVYTSGYDQVYPFVDMQSIPNMNVVTKLTRTFGGNEVNQIFSYAKAVVHEQGLGFLGFGELTRSNWHTNSSDVNRSYTISVMDPQQRGAQIKNFVTKTSYINLNVKNAALINPPPVGGIADGASLNDYISRTDQIYTNILMPNKVYVNIPLVTSTKDVLNNTSETQSFIYDTYYNPTKTTINYGAGLEKVVDATYDNSLGADYYIGRPLTVKTTLNNGSGTFSTSEEYSYSGSLPSQVRKKNNNAPFTTEDFSYNTFGNLINKVTTVPGGVQRAISMKYDATGRFMVEETDIDGLVTSYSHNAATGAVNTITNPYGQTEDFLYDGWGRQIVMTDFFGKKTYRNYASDGGNVEIIETDDQGKWRMNIINALGQEIERREKNILGQITGKASQYDVYGRLVADSETGSVGNYSQWNYTVYDQYGRVQQTTNFRGKVTSLSYSGLSTTVNDGAKSVTTTKNPLGQTISLQDPGGTINYSYFASGEVKSMDYGGISQVFEEDAWGRKAKLTDPSAGVYQYEYDGFSQIIKESTPKGITEYTYDATGKVLQKKISGDGTDMVYMYTYNSGNKLLTNMTLTNGDGNHSTHTYSYDAFNRLSSTVEDNLHARFTKSFTYDEFSRVSTESYQAQNKLNNITVLKTLEMQYQNGEHLQTTLQQTGQVIWKVNAIDSKGLLASSMMGSNLKASFQYDEYGFPKQRTIEKVSGTGTPLMVLNSSFDAQRGLLNSRSNTALAWNESFGYDNLDRLTSFNDNDGNNSQTYDNRGRITSNSQLGTYSYDSNNYRQTELALNPVSDLYYQSRSLQQITYNAFKSPVEIVEPGRGRVSFQYNALLDRSHMYYGDEQVEKMLRRYRRHYAGDGSVEITNDFQTGTTSFVFYLGGDAYSAPSIWKEVHSPGQINQGLYFLHRDHMGSIVMVTNDQGDVIEKRAFDAWGNVVKLTDGNGNNLAAFIVTDRGFTGHEHLLELGLIHMNARLYDPKLHRFLAPDNYIQNPYNTQNFNRYGYVMNNPLMYTDPTGEFFFSLILPGIGTFIDAALWGAVIGGAAYTATIALSDGGFKNWSWGEFGKSVGLGAVSGVVTAGIGSMLGPIGSNGFVGELARAYMHGFSNGVIAGFTGGDFMQGFASGGLGSIAGSALMMYGGSFGNSKFGNFVFSGVSGGIGAELTGDNFWRGAGIGVMNAGLNHFQNSIQERIAQIAENYEKSTLWAFDVKNGDFPNPSNKCNLFVYDVTTEAGASPGLPHKMKGFKGFPPLAAEWADPNYKIKGWKVVKTPSRGAVAAEILTGGGSSYSGHVGIVVAKGTTVSASNSFIKKGNWGFRAGQNVVFRKWVGR